MPQPPLFISIEEFHARAAKGEKPEGGLRKAFGGCVVKAVEGQERTVEIRISTASRDRDHDTINPQGWKLANYRKNPVVLFGHDYRSLPIGKDTGITVDELGLLAHPQFCPEDLHPMGSTVYRMLVEGFLNAASVGMNPVKWSYNEEERGIDFEEQELLEYSIVPVPANPEALVGAKAAGIDLAPLKAYAEQLLDQWHGEAGIWLPRKNLERALQLAGGEHLVIVVPADLAPEKAARLKGLVGEKRSITVDELLAMSPATKTGDTPTDPPAPLIEAPPAAAPPEDYLEIENEPAAGDVLDADVTPERISELAAEAATAAVDESFGRRFLTLSGRLD